MQNRERLTSEEPVYQSPLRRGRRRRKAAVKQRTCSGCWWLDGRLPLNLEIQTETHTIYVSVDANGIKKCNQKQKENRNPTGIHRFGAGASTAALTPTAECALAARGQVLIVEVQHGTLEEDFS